MKNHSNVLIPPDWTMDKEFNHMMELMKDDPVEDFEEKWKIIDELSEDDFVEFLSEATQEVEEGDYWLDAIAVDELRTLVDAYKRKVPTELTCHCLRQKQYMCALCGVTRDGLNEPWRALARIPVGTTTATPKSSPTPKDDGLGSWNRAYYDSDDFWAMAGGCRHYGTIVYIQDVAFYASSMKNKRSHEDFVPDFGIYCDSMWEPVWRNEHIHWPDHGSPTDPVIGFEQILSGVELAVAGLDVEFGCIGGHGRTGTALAVAAVILGMEPESAIDHIRDAYCKDAIESRAQEWYVHWVYAMLNGKEAPERPPVAKSKWMSTPAGSSVSVTPVCVKEDHYTDWKRGLKSCTKRRSECSFWTMDVRTFENGTYVSNSDSAVFDSYNGPRVTVDGFTVPKPIAGSHGHAPGRRLGCICDVCRYRELGFSAFLEPSYTMQAERVRWLADMARLTKVLERVESKKNGDIWVNYESVDGVVRDMIVTDTFTPMPPDHIGVPGDVSGEYKWKAEYGWVWQKLILTKEPGYKKQTKRERQAKRKAELAASGEKRNK